MQHRSIRGFVVVVAVLSAGTLAVRATDEIHACPDAKGNVIYQDDPCPDLPAKPPAKPKAAKPQAAPAKPKAATPAKRAAVAPAPTFHARPVEPARTAEPWRGGPFPTSPDATPRSGRARYASPEQTWLTFLGAIWSGDRSGALACLAPAAQLKFGDRPEAFPVEALRRTLDEFTRIDVEGDVGPLWSIRAVRPNLPPKWIFFERTDGGEWKIAAI
ncbi:MAG TPA: hypothetical protein VJS92_03025 [Candidatus Polarisedimenticolaceae bacterium]|nr:hypothetical protein [Candidatus Polarisedimenticolaceae bacterium]